MAHCCVIILITIELLDRAQSPSKGMAAAAVFVVPAGS